MAVTQLPAPSDAAPPDAAEAPAPKLRREIVLRPYQREAGCAVMRSVLEGLGRTITVEIARQGGKNELSAQVEALLLTTDTRGRDGIKTAPTYRPQLRISMHRLWARLLDRRLTLARRTDNEISLGRTRMLFLSAEPDANVVGHTASLILEVDEAQDIEPEKFDRDFRPMASSTSATCVMYGTAWDDRTLLERQIQANLEAERRDRSPEARRHFACDWEEVARYNPSYAGFVEAERARLGETHPLFLTQYCLKTIGGGGRLFSASQRAQLAGAHERIAQPRAGEAYVAGLDLAGGTPPRGPLPAGEEGEQRLVGAQPAAPAPAAPAAHDSTVLTIGRLRYDDALPWTAEPRVEIVEHAAWTGEPHETLLPRLIDLLRNVWRAERVCVDATGLGETAARLLAAALGESRVEGVKFTAESKSRLGFELVAAVNGGRLKAYRGDGSAEHREFWRQFELARVAYRANRTMNFFVEAADGHDDYLVSAALLVHASRGRLRRVATGRVRG
jgi:hypothetical protein